VRAAAVLISVISLSFSAACGDASSAAAPNAVPATAAPRKVLRLQQEPLARSVTVSGTLAAEEQVTLSFKVTGRVEQLRVDLGSTVRKGDLIARLTPTDFELRLRQADAALQQARARLGLDPTGESDLVDAEQTAVVRQARAALTEARRQRERIATFVERGISAKADLETADAALEIAEGRHQDALEEVRNRQAVLAQRRSEVALARQQLDDTALHSPIDGVVRERLVFAGEYRSAGTPIATVVRQHPLRLQLAVPERASTMLRIGQRVLVTVEGDSTAHEGRVTRVSPSIAEGTRTLPIEAEIPNVEGKLRPGTFAKADIVTEEKAALVVPQTALVVFAGVEKVLVVKDGKVHEQRVRTGVRTGDRVELIEGVKPGDVVIISPGGLADGSPVTIAE
jgi:multidrug efflux pump subunit AcrA (membrane-fusion protein)